MVTWTNERIKYEAGQRHAEIIIEHLGLNCSSKSVQTPSVVEMMEDLLTPNAGFAIAEREVTPKETGGSPRHLHDLVLGVVRANKLIRVDDPEVDALELGDRLLYIRSADAER